MLGFTTSHYKVPVALGHGLHSSRFSKLPRAHTTPALTHANTRACYPPPNSTPLHFLSSGINRPPRRFLPTTLWHAYAQTVCDRGVCCYARAHACIRRLLLRAATPSPRARCWFAARAANRATPWTSGPLILSCSVIARFARGALLTYSAHAFSWFWLALARSVCRAVLRARDRPFSILRRQDTSSDTRGTGDLLDCGGRTTGQDACLKRYLLFCRPPSAASPTLDSTTDTALPPGTCHAHPSTSPTGFCARPHCYRCLGRGHRRTGRKTPASGTFPTPHWAWEGSIHHLLGGPRCSPASPAPPAPGLNSALMTMVRALSVRSTPRCLQRSPLYGPACTLRARRTPFRRRRDDRNARVNTSRPDRHHLSRALPANCLLRVVYIKLLPLRLRVPAPPFSARYRTRLQRQIPSSTLPACE